MARTIERLRFIDQGVLRTRLESIDEPCIIEGAIDASPALERWSATYLKDKFGSVEIAYKISSCNAHPDLRADRIESMFRLKTSSFSTFIDAITTGPAEERARFLLTGDEEFLLRRRGGVETRGPALGRLLDDVRLPNVIPDDRLYSVWPWLSAAGVFTWLHYDNNGCHNLNAQLRGRKRVRLYAPDELAALAPFPPGGENPAHNVSQIDLEAPDAARFPDFSAAESWDGTLEAGELLFIPAWWWHAFWHLGAFNANVNFWWKPEQPRDSAVARYQARLDSEKAPSRPPEP